MTQNNSTTSTAKVLFVGAQDHANLAHRISRSLNALAGATVSRVWVRDPHPWGSYQEDVVGIEPGDAIQDFAAWADWLVTTGDGNYKALASMRACLPLRPGVLLAVTHAGTAYRTQSAAYNEADAAMGARVRFVGCDSLRLATSGPHAFPYWAPAEGIAMPDVLSVPAPGKVRVAHAPSNRATKGTDEILRGLRMVGEKHDFELDIIEQSTPAGVLRRMAEAHIFVDQINAEVGGFGCAAVEAMASGCAVISDMRNVPESSDDYDPDDEEDDEDCDDYIRDPTALETAGVDRPPIINAQHHGQIIHAMGMFFDYPWTIDRARAASLAWARKWADPKAFARYFLGILGRHA